MGGFDIKPGATTARDIAHARMPESEAGKRTNVYDTGIDWIDRGPVCTGRAGQPGCFWSDDQRGRLIQDFQLNVDHAEQQFGLALERIRLDEIVSKPDDLNWFLSLALDIVGAHLVAVFTRSIMKAAGPALDAARRSAADAVVDAALHGEEVARTWRARATEMILKVTPQQVASLSTAAFVPAKNLAKKELAAGISHTPSAAAKSATLAYINQLSRAAAVSFRQYRLDACGHANDAELAVLWTGMSPENHNVDDFQPVLADKIARFKKSGVGEIGTTTIEYGEGQLRSKTRVVFVQDIYGSKTAWYEKQHQDFEGKGRAPTDGPTLDRRVPEEFVEAAVQRSEQVWGATLVFDDGYVQQLRESGVDVSEMRKRLTAPTPSPHGKPVPADSIFARGPKQPGVFADVPQAPLYAPGSVFDLPRQAPEHDPIDLLAPFRSVKP